MAKAAIESASKRRTYFAAQPPGTRRILRQMRSAIRAAAPDAVEAFSYGIPGFRLDGRPLIWYAGWKAHTSVYPMSETIRRTHARELSGCEFSKGTIRFPLDSPPSPTLLARLVKARIAEVRKARPASAARGATARRRAAGESEAT
jgi:uncharacterized protein YdhG (YjbR/CyaY superfamily)